MRYTRLAVLLFTTVHLRLTEAPAQTRRLVPVADYHTHLASEAAIKLLSVPSVTEIELPAEIDLVIRQWERATQAGDRSALATLFTADGLMGIAGGWVRGNDAIRGAAAHFDPEDVRVRAHAFSIGDTVATVTASLADRASSAVRDVAKVAFTLRRTSGRWLIGTVLREARSPSNGAVFTADRLIQLLDSAGIKRAVVLSEAFWFGSEVMWGIDRTLSISGEQATVQAENDWLAAQVAKYPNRLVGFCSVNPLKSYAVEVIERCGSNPAFGGLKFHLANSAVDLRSANDVALLARAFRAANQQRLPIVVHMRPRFAPYGREDVETMLREVFSEAPDVPIQIAHFAGWGGYDDATDQAVGAFADAIKRNDRATRNLYFDIAQIVFPGAALEQRQQIARRIRQLGLHRVVFGSDVANPNGSPARWWDNILTLIPLTKAELATIASNVTPYLVPKRR